MISQHPKGRVQHVAISAKRSCHGMPVGTTIYVAQRAEELQIKQLSQREARSL